MSAPSRRRSERSSPCYEPRLGARTSLSCHLPCPRSSCCWGRKVEQAPRFPGASQVELVIIASAAAARARIEGHLRPGRLRRWHARAKGDGCCRGCCHGERQALPGGIADGRPRGTSPHLEAIRACRRIPPCSKSNCWWGRRVEQATMSLGGSAGRTGTHSFRRHHSQSH